MIDLFYFKYFYSFINFDTILQGIKRTTIDIFILETRGTGKSLFLLK